MIERRQDIINEARKWVGTPYHHCGDVLGVGVDCAMLLVRTYVDCGLIKPFDPRPYSTDWHLHRTDEMYIEHIIKTAGCHEVAEPKPGDVAVWKWGKTHSHGAIVVEWPNVIQALARERVVIEGPPPDYLAKYKSIRFFSLWGTPI